jgi:hypothetical protein
VHIQRLELARLVERAVQDGQQRLGHESMHTSTRSVQSTN